NALESVSARYFAGATVNSPSAFMTSSKRPFGSSVLFHSASLGSQLSVRLVIVGIALVVVPTAGFSAQRSKPKEIVVVGSKAKSRKSLGNTKWGDIELKRGIDTSQTKKSPKLKGN